MQEEAHTTQALVQQASRVRRMGKALELGHRSCILQRTYSITIHLGQASTGQRASFAGTAGSRPAAVLVGVGGMEACSFPRS